MSSAASDTEPSRRNWVSFWNLLVLQGQNAFNDKAAQFLLVPMGAWLFMSEADISGLKAMKYIEYILAMVIVSPFILFSPLAGWISDRFSKTWVVRGSSILQLVVLLGITAAIYYHQIWFAIAGFFMLSVQSVILSPAKRGIVKELVGSEKLGFASGLMEITAILAICGGQIITGFWYTARLESGLDGWDAALFPLIAFTVASVGALAISSVIEKVPAQGSLKFRWKIPFEHIDQIGEVLRVRAIRLSAAGAAFFWGFAGYLNLAAINMAKQLTEGRNNFAEVSAVLMFAASLGIVLGGAIASGLCKKRIELGLIPVGGLVMVLGSLTLAMTPMDSPWLKVCFVFAGFGGALFLVPLNANLQDLCPPEKRGKILAGLNLMDCLAGLTAAVVQLGLVYLNVSFKWQFFGLAVLCLIVANYAAKLLPQHFVRLLILGFFKMFYRIRSVDVDRIPKEGGVLLVSNHVTYVDAFILSAACPREIRFLMFDEYFKQPWVGKFVRIFNTVPISQTRAKEAVRVAATALEEGAVVCIFPEGQLARTGVMNEFKRGFEMIARKAGCPVLPVAMDGLWGSIFSFERNKFIYKLPYRIPYGVNVHFGEPILPADASSARVRRSVESLRADAFALRQVLAKPMKLLGKRVSVVGADREEYYQRVRELVALPEEERVQLVANALQIGEINAIERGQTVMLEWDALENCRDVLGVVFAQYFGLKIVMVKTSASPQEVMELREKHQVDTCFGAASLCEKWDGSGCYDFSENSHERDTAFPCLVTKGRVLAVSMPHPEAQTATNQHQEGHRKGTWGRLLPGFHVKIEGSEILLTGASLPSEGVEIDGVSLDASGMLHPCEVLQTLES